jgi:hypothetical protein
MITSEERNAHFSMNNFAEFFRQIVIIIFFKKKTLTDPGLLSL